jgi:hypothetical protein
MKLVEILKDNLLKKINEDFEGEFSKATSRISPFNVSPVATCEAMKLALNSYNINFAKVGETNTINLPGVEKNTTYKLESQQRFIQWYSDVIKNPDAVTLRGKSFEGLIGGVFGGKVTNFEGKSNKTDVNVNGENLSVKFSENFKPDGGQQLGGITMAIDAQLKVSDNIIRQIGINKVNSSNLKNTFEKVLNLGEEGIKFIKKALNVADSFEPINYFVFGNYSNTNQVNVYQYTKDDIINHIINGNYNINSIGQIGVKNLQILKPKILTINFPQFIKSKRRKYDSEDITQNDINLETPILVLTIKNKQNDIVGKIYRTLKPINYYIKSDINLEKKLELETINQAVFNDIKYFSENNFNNKNKIFKNYCCFIKQEEDCEKNKNFNCFMDELKKYSDLKSKELFVLSSKISEKGREKGIKNLFGGRGETINPVVIQNIRKNPARFFKNMFEIYGCDKNGVNKIENAINQVFGVEVQLPIASYCTTNNVSEMVKKISNLLINEQTKTEVETKVANIDDIAIELLPINFVKTINVKLSQNEELKNKINQIYNEQLTKNPLTYLKSKGIVPYIFLVPNYITGVGFVTTGLAVKIGNTPITVSMNLGTDPKNIPSSLKFSQVRMNFPINK